MRDNLLTFLPLVAVLLIAAGLAIPVSARTMRLLGALAALCVVIVLVIIGVTA